MRVNSRFNIGDKELYQHQLTKRMDKKKIPYKYGKYILRMSRLDYLLLLDFDDERGVIEFRTSVSPTDLIENFMPLVPPINEGVQNLPTLTCKASTKYHKILADYTLVYELNLTGYSNLSDDEKAEYLSRVYEAVLPYRLVPEQKKKNMFFNK